MIKRMTGFLAAIALSVGSSPTLSPLVSDSPGFVEAGQRLSENIDAAIDPCVDFNKFACGNFLKNYTGKDSPDPTTVIWRKLNKEMIDLLESPPREGESAAAQMVRHLYSSCMEKEVGESKLDFFKESCSNAAEYFTIQGDPMKSIDLNSLLEFFPYNPLFAIDFHKSETGDNSITLKQRNIILNNDTIEEVMRMMSIISSDEEIKNELNLMIQLEERLFDFAVESPYTSVKISELGTMFDLIDWPRYIKAATPLQIHSYIDGDPSVTASEELLKHFREILTETDPREIINYVIVVSAGKIYDDFGIASTKNTQELTNSTFESEKEERRKFCLSIAEKPVDAYSALYVANHFSPETRQATKTMVNDLVEAFVAILSESDWMDDSTKQNAIDKLKKMRHLIGHLDWILDNEKLDSRYTGLDIELFDDFATSLNKWHRWSSKDFIPLVNVSLPQTIGFDLWPHHVNAENNLNKNYINIPAALVQPPFFSTSFPAALNYGGLGSTIGHEITHGFDHTRFSKGKICSNKHRKKCTVTNDIYWKGVTIDADGKYVDWWNQKAKEVFDGKAKCVVDQYSNITIGNTRLNGKLHLDENIADISGIKEAYRAYKIHVERNGEEASLPNLSEYSNDQLFFIAYAQTWCEKGTPEEAPTEAHPPNKYRILTVLANQKEFAEAFQCRPGTPMNPDHKCVVWFKK